MGCAQSLHSVDKGRDQKYLKPPSPTVHGVPRGAAPSAEGGTPAGAERQPPAAEQNAIDALLSKPGGGSSMAVLSLAQLRAALQSLSQPVVVLTCPYSGAGGEAGAPLYDTLLTTTGTMGGAESSPRAPGTFRLSMDADGEAGLQLHTEQGLTSLHCALANSAALRMLGVHCERDVLGFLASSFRSDRGLVSLFQDTVKRLLAGHLTPAKHFVPGNFGRSRFFLSMRISPFVFNTGAPHPCGGPGGSLIPALVLELDVPYEGRELASRLQRDYLVISHIPSLVTIFDTAGRVLHQNHSSISYMGYLAGWSGLGADGVGVGASCPHRSSSAIGTQRSGGGRPDDTGSAGAAPWTFLQSTQPLQRQMTFMSTLCEGQQEAHTPLQRLFALDPGRLAAMAAALAEGKEWRGLVRMPPSLLPDAAQQDTQEDSQQDTGQDDQGVEGDRDEQDAEESWRCGEGRPAQSWGSAAGKGRSIASRGGSFSRQRRASAVCPPGPSDPSAAAAGDAPPQHRGGRPRAHSTSTVLRQMRATLLQHRAARLGRTRSERMMGNAGVAASTAADPDGAAVGGTEGAEGAGVQEASRSGVEPSAGSAAAAVPWQGLPATVVRSALMSSPPLPALPSARGPPPSARSHAMAQASCAAAEAEQAAARGTAVWVATAPVACPPASGGAVRPDGVGGGEDGGGGGGGGGDGGSSAAIGLAHAGKEYELRGAAFHRPGLLADVGEDEAEGRSEGGSPTAPTSLSMAEPARLAATAATAATPATTLATCPGVAPLQLGDASPCGSVANASQQLLAIGSAAALAPALRVPAGPAPAAGLHAPVARPLTRRVSIKSAMGHVDAGGSTRRAVLPGSGSRPGSSSGLVCRNRGSTGCSRRGDGRAAATSAAAFAGSASSGQPAHAVAAGGGADLVGAQWAHGDSFSGGDGSSGNNLYPADGRGEPSDARSLALFLATRTSTTNDAFSIELLTRSICGRGSRGSDTPRSGPSTATAPAAAVRRISIDDCASFAWHQSPVDGATTAAKGHLLKAPTSARSLNGASSSKRGAGGAGRTTSGPSGQQHQSMNRAAMMWEKGEVQLSGLPAAAASAAPTDAAAAVSAAAVLAGSGDDGGAKQPCAILDGMCASDVCHDAAGEDAGSGGRSCSRSTGGRPSRSLSAGSVRTRLASSVTLGLAAEALVSQAGYEEGEEQGDLGGEEGGEASQAPVPASSLELGRGVQASRAEAVDMSAVLSAWYEEFPATALIIGGGSGGTSGEVAAAHSSSQAVAASIESGRVAAEAVAGGEDGSHSLKLSLPHVTQYRSACSSPYTPPTPAGRQQQQQPYTDTQHTAEPLPLAPGAPGTSRQGTGSGMLAVSPVAGPPFATRASAPASNNLATVVSVCDSCLPSCSSAAATSTGMQSWAGTGTGQHSLVAAWPSSQSPSQGGGCRTSASAVAAAWAQGRCAPAQELPAKAEDAARVGSVLVPAAGNAAAAAASAAAAAFRRPTPQIRQLLAAHLPASAPHCTAAAAAGRALTLASSPLVSPWHSRAPSPSAAPFAPYPFLDGPCGAASTSASVSSHPSILHHTINEDQKLADYLLPPTATLAAMTAAARSPVAGLQRPAQPDQRRRLGLAPWVQQHCPRARTQQQQQQQQPRMAGPGSAGAMPGLSAAAALLLASPDAPASTAAAMHGSLRPHSGGTHLNPVPHAHSDSSADMHVAGRNGPRAHSLSMSQQPAISGFSASALPRARSHTQSVSGAGPQPQPQQDPRSRLRSLLRTLLADTRAVNGLPSNAAFRRSNTGGSSHDSRKKGPPSLQQVRLPGSSPALACRRYGGMAGGMCSSPQLQLQLPRPSFAEGPSSTASGMDSQGQDAVLNTYAAGNGTVSATGVASASASASAALLLGDSAAWTQDEVMRSLPLAGPGRASRWPVTGHGVGGFGSAWADEGGDGSAPFGAIEARDTVGAYFGEAEGVDSDAAGVRWHEIVVKPVSDPMSGERVLLVVQTDVTNQVRAEEVLARVLEAEHRLLADVFPRHVVAYMTAARKNDVERSRNGLQLLRHIQDPTALATSHECITVLFADIKGFTEMCKEVSAAAVMTFLNDLYTRLDSLTDVYGVYKVETIGDCYMCAGGLMARDEDGYGAVRRQGDTDPLHAMRVVAFARAMIEEASRVMLPGSGRPVQMRIGLHSGPATSGVVGQKMPRFCLFGDTINTASRMESTGRPGCIHVSAATRVMLSAGEEEAGWVATGGVEVKGKGRMDSYLWCPDTEGASRQRRHRQQRAMLLATLPNAIDLMAPAAAAGRGSHDSTLLSSAMRRPPLAADGWGVSPPAAGRGAAGASSAPIVLASTAAASPAAAVPGAQGGIGGGGRGGSPGDSPPLPGGLAGRTASFRTLLRSRFSLNASAHT